MASYFAMLEASLRGEDINKAAYNRALQPLLSDRTKAAIEYKYQNISAVLIDLGVPSISGYKPAFNYQGNLRTVVIAQLEARRVLREVVAQSVEAVPAGIASGDPATVFVDRPPPVERPSRRSSAPALRDPVDWVQMEARNVALGLAGERFVIDLERERLERAGKSRLAAQVEHVSIDRGDGLGYDILSYEEDSRERLIEVKTTKYSEYTPFYVTRNELAVSQQYAPKYQLYRLYSFGSNSRVFRIPGALDAGLELDPVSYVARVS